MRHRTGSYAGPPRPVVRWLSVAVVALAALLGCATPSHATSPPAAAPAQGTPAAPVLCPHVESGHVPPGDSGLCGTHGRDCPPALVPPLPPVVTESPSCAVPPWLATPDVAAVYPDVVSSRHGPDLNSLGISRT